MIQLGFLDPFRLIVWAFRERASLKTGEIEGVSHLAVIDGKWRHPNMDKWGTLKAGIARARKMAERGEMRIVRVEMEAIEAGEAMPWERGLQNEVVVRLPLVTNPGMMLYESVASVCPGPGYLWAMGGAPLWRSMANHGEHQVLSLVLHLRQRDIEDESD